MDLDHDVFAATKVIADSGFHCNVVVAAVEATGADAYIADRDYRKREPAFAGASRHKARDKKERGLRRKREREARENAESKYFTVNATVIALPVSKHRRRPVADVTCALNASDIPIAHLSVSSRS